VIDVLIPVAVLTFWALAFLAGQSAYWRIRDWRYQRWSRRYWQQRADENQRRMRQRDRMVEQLHQRVRVEDYL
jgi:hypothetical protein